MEIKNESSVYDILILIFSLHYINLYEYQKKVVWQQTSETASESKENENTHFLSSIFQVHVYNKCNYCQMNICTIIIFYMF